MHWRVLTLPRVTHITNDNIKSDRWRTPRSRIKVGAKTNGTFPNSRHDHVLKQHLCFTTILCYRYNKVITIPNFYSVVIEIRLDVLNTCGCLKQIIPLYTHTHTHWSYRIHKGLNVQKKICWTASAVEHYPWWPHYAPKYDFPQKSCKLFKIVYTPLV